MEAEQSVTEQSVTQEETPAMPEKKPSPEFTPKSIARGKKFYKEHGEDLKEFDDTLRSEEMKKRGVKPTF